MVEKIDKVGHNDTCLEFAILVKETDVVGMQARGHLQQHSNSPVLETTRKKKELHKFIWKAWLDVS